MSRKLLQLTLLAMLTFASIFVAGCVKQSVILVPPGEPVQLSEDVRAYIFITVDGKKVKSEHRVTLPAGWWCLPDERE